MGILSRLLHGDRADNGRDKQRIAKVVERIVELSPQLRLVRRYQARFEPAIAAALAYADKLVASLPAPREASAGAWASDPYIHAFFAAPDDIAPTLSRSADLRAYFEQNPDAPEACAVLGMAMTERNRLGVALEGETMRRDVVQTTVSFSDHRVRMCGRAETDLRQEIVRRIIEQLGLEGLARIAEDKSRRDLLEQERALLKTRLQLLERQGVGMRAMLGGDAEEDSGQLARLQEQIGENERNLEALGIVTEALDRDLDSLCAVLANPSPHLYVESKCMRLDRMNVVLEEGSTQTGEDVTFQIARLPMTPPQRRAFALIRFARGDLQPAVNMLDEAARLLI
jgi:hypothetical protein